MVEIFDTNEIESYVFSDEHKQGIIESNYDDDDEMTVDDINHDWLVEDYQLFVQDQLEDFNEALKGFLKRYEKRYSTSVHSIVFLGTRSSHYGWIGGAGDAVGKHFIGEVKWIDADAFSFHMTEDRTLELRTHDHDGTNSMEMIVITQNEYDHAYEVEYEEDMRVYMSNKGKRATKLDKQFLNYFGYFNAPVNNEVA